MRILIATVQVPFIRGGAEVHGEGLRDALRAAGHEVEIIGLRFPAYLIPHSNKVLWILHQFRTAYELWDHQLGDLIYSPNGVEVRDAIRQADRQFIAQAKLVFANSANVAARLK